ncbi:ATP-binding protein [Ammonifex thiophilus]|uniref:AAA family ATPase n=1 Tax=Ammonifex thiophilus TaxID=444093 RepID=A0A3D8P389_9THEO|nr:ATP-binding protein [Ammonifex thiophilus]RDV83205.1 AAA family ATPase [Ammonifex thiophilus]
MECSQCGGRGLIVRGDKAYLCPTCRRRKIKARILALSKLTPQMRKYTFDRFDFRFYSPYLRDEEKGITYYESARRAVEAAKAFVRDFLSGKAEEGLIFTGAVGSGKTFLACCIANAVLDAGREVLFLVVPDFLDEIRASYDEEGAFSEQEILLTAKTVPLLILDDLGAFIYSEWARQKIYSLLDYRLNHRLPVVVTTNVRLEDLGESLGERTISRLIALCRPYRLLVEHDIRILLRQEKEADRRF